MFDGVVDIGVEHVNGMGKQRIYKGILKYLMDETKNHISVQPFTDPSYNNLKTVWTWSTYMKAYIRTIKKGFKEIIGILFFAILIHIKLKWSDAPKSCYSPMLRNHNKLPRGCCATIIILRYSSLELFFLSNYIFLSVAIHLISCRLLKNLWPLTQEVDLSPQKFVAVQWTL